VNIFKVFHTKRATFRNCLLVESHRPGCTQDLDFTIERALQETGLLKAQIIEWYFMGVGHRVDGSLDLDTKQIKPPHQASPGLGHLDETPTSGAGVPGLW